MTASASQPGALELDVEAGELVGPPPQARAGVIVPYDMALDAELWRWTPADVTLHFTRTPFAPLPVTLEMAMLVSDADVVARCTQDLLPIAPEVCVYACTSGSFVKGLAGQAELVSAMEAVGAPRAVTTSGALLEAIEHLGLHRVAIATPYDLEITIRLAEFLAEAGVEVVGRGCLALEADIWDVPYAKTARLVADADTADADAVIVSCTNLPTYDVIAPLERALGKPVITANQATMWAAMRAIGRQPVGSGQALHR